MAEEMGVIMSSNLGASHWCGELGVLAGPPRWPFLILTDRSGFESFLVKR